MISKLSLGGGFIFEPLLRIEYKSKFYLPQVSMRRTLRRGKGVREHDDMHVVVQHI